MQIRLKMAWGQWSKGHVFTNMPGGQARTLIARGVAEVPPTEEASPAAAKSAFRSPADRAMRPSRMLRKAR